MTHAAAYTPNRIEMSKEFHLQTHSQGKRSLGGICLTSFNDSCAWRGKVFPDPSPVCQFLGGQKTNTRCINTSYNATGRGDSMCRMSTPRITPHKIRSLKMAVVATKERPDSRRHSESTAANFSIAIVTERSNVRRSSRQKRPFVHQLKAFGRQKEGVPSVGVSVEPKSKAEDIPVSTAMVGGGVFVTVDKLGNNKRRVEARVAISAPLEAVWGVLTDYDNLADHIPGLAVSQLLERRSNGARVLQIGETNLTFGVKFQAKAVVEVTEASLEVLPDGTRRDLHFETVEGDFQIFRGTWCMHQVGIKPASGLQGVDVQQRVQTYLSYILEVQPKRWIPVALIEGILTNEIIANLTSVRTVALRNQLSLDIC